MPRQSETLTKKKHTHTYTHTHTLTQWDKGGNVIQSRMLPLSLLPLYKRPPTRRCPNQYRRVNEQQNTVPGSWSFRFVCLSGGSIPAATQQAGPAHMVNMQKTIMRIRETPQRPAQHGNEEPVGPFASYVSCRAITPAATQQAGPARMVQTPQPIKQNRKGARYPAIARPKRRLIDQHSTVPRSASALPLRMFWLGNCTSSHTASWPGSHGTNALTNPTKPERGLLHCNRTTQKTPDRPAQHGTEERVSPPASYVLAGQLHQQPHSKLARLAWYKCPNQSHETRKGPPTLQ